MAGMLFNDHLSGSELTLCLVLIHHLAIISIVLAGVVNKDCVLARPTCHLITSCRVARSRVCLSFSSCRLMDQTQGPILYLL